MIYLAVDTQASINRAAEITLSSIERAKRILDQNDPRKLKSGARRTISVRQSDLDLAAYYLARQYAEKALAILASHKVPASSWTDTDEYRGEIRRGAQKTLNQLSEKQG